MSTFSYSIDEHGDRPTARVEGEIDLAAVTEFEAAMQALYSSTEGGDAAIDMERVAFLDSSGLRVLMKAHQQWADDGATLVICKPASAVSRLFEITGLLETLTIE